jgi:hypothetical protein
MISHVVAAILTIVYFTLFCLLARAVMPNPPIVAMGVSAAGGVLLKVVSDRLGRDPGADLAYALPWVALLALVYMVWTTQGAR